MYCTVIKHDGHLRIEGKCRKHEPYANVFYISRLRYSLRLLYCKTIKHAFSMFYTLIKHRFLTNQSARRVLSIF